VNIKKNKEEKFSFIHLKFFIGFLEFFWLLILKDKEEKFSLINLEFFWILERTKT
jgi:hypothetical protein